jgi:hypothetical protein
MLKIKIYKTIILPFVLHGYETSYKKLRPRKEHAFRGFEDK